MADNKVNSGLLEFSEDQKVFVALDAETSEVKKAVTIDEDGVETDIQGVQPSGKKEITSTAEVNVASYATAQVVDEDLVAGNIKKDVDILGVVGSYEPEAPASDFSTATLTVTGGPITNSTIPALLVDPENDIEGAYGSTNGLTSPITVILYKGKAYADLPQGTVTGGIVYDEDIEMYVITGDGTITI